MVKKFIEKFRAPNKKQKKKITNCFLFFQENGILTLNARAISALGRLKRIEYYINQENASILHLSTYLKNLHRALEVSFSKTNVHKKKPRKRF